MKVSEKGASLIAGFEGGQSKDGKFHPYRDAVGVWTIGYGHTKGVTQNSKPLTKKEALELLRKDLDKTYAPPVNDVAERIGLKLKQHEFDALVSAVYNLGPGILGKGRTMGNALRSKNRLKIANAFLVYVMAGGRRLQGLVNRRHAERQHFLGH